MEFYLSQKDVHAGHVTRSAAKDLADQDMSSAFNGDFARLVPRNRIAQLLFSETVVYVKQDQTFHFRFIERNINESSRASSEPVEDSTEYDTYPETDVEDSRVKSIEQAGHFVLSFHRDRTPELPHLGWRVGKGSGRLPANRGVDLLLAKPGDVLSKSLASIHMVLLFNLRSGFLMLRAGSKKAPVEFKVGAKWEKLEYQEERLMHQPATMLRAGACEYELEYTIEEKHRKAYFERRDKFLEALLPSTEPTQRPFQKMPGDSCVFRGRYLEFETQGSGAFGWITQGVDTKTGNPIAIKELRIDSHRSRVEIMTEVKMGRRFVKERGLLPILEAQCEHGKPDGCGQLEKFYIFMPHARSDFSVNFWSNPALPRRTKLHLLREPLEGIGVLHAMGIMHRDIRPKNMLIISVKPPQASLCDYGKAIEAANSTVTTIGPIHTLAPEVWTVSTDGPYNAKIDMWAYGYAIAEILGYSVAKYPGLDGYRTNNPRITRNRHVAILEMLHAHCNTVSEDAPVVDLVSKLLVWEAEGRWSADQALEHVCWDPLIQGQDERKAHRDNAEEGPSGAKRTQFNDPRLRSDGISRPSTIDTVEFSQATKDMIQRQLER